MVTTATQQVGSHIAVVQFGASQVPIGFLASFRKRNHLSCETGRGFLTRITSKEGRSQMVCGCAVTRAMARLKKDGVVAFEDASQKWLVDERRRLQAHEAACHEEGKKAGVEAKCPYPTGTDQHFAWMAGQEEARATAVVP